MITSALPTHPALDTRLNPESMCRFSGTADDLGTWSVEFYGDAPAMLCDTHGLPANGEAQETGVGLCYETERDIEEHTGFYRTVHDDPVTEDRAHCRCGRPVAACPGRDAADRIRADLAERQTTYAKRMVYLSPPRATSHWPVLVYAATDAEAIAAARYRLATEQDVQVEDSWVAVLPGATS